MTTALLLHDDGLGHDMGEGHPERPARLKVLKTLFDTPPFAGLARIEPPPGTREAMARAHPPAYLDALLEARPAAGETTRLDADTAMSAGTWAAVERAVGAACRGVDLVASGQVRNAFAAMRPPGHHAERSRPMGFCFINQVAVAARHAQAAHGLSRIAILDFDVHHGNGTQDIFWDDPTVLYCSTHEMPLYPGTGAAAERGTHDTIVNAPLRSGDGGEAFRAAITARVLPRMDVFRPDLVLLSAGFDAHVRDPLASLRLEAEDFAWVTREMLALADRHAGGRLVSVLEGGYDLEGLTRSAEAHVLAMMAHSPA